MKFRKTKELRNLGNTMEGMVPNDISVEDDKLIKEFYRGMYVTNDMAATYYDKRASTYDYIIQKTKAFDIVYVSKELADCFQKEDLGNKLIVDVGAGTGLLGKSMSEYGFTQLHALDVSMGSLDEARKKNVYQDFLCCK